MGFLSGIGNALKGAIDDVSSVADEVENLTTSIGKEAAEVAVESAKSIIERVTALTEAEAESVINYAVANVEVEFAPLFSGLTLLTGKVDPASFVENQFATVISGTGLSALTDKALIHTHKKSAKEAISITPKADAKKFADFFTDHPALKKKALEQANQMADILNGLKSNTSPSLEEDSNDHLRNIHMMLSILNKLDAAPEAKAS